MRSAVFLFLLVVACDDTPAATDTTPEVTNEVAEVGVTDAANADNPEVGPGRVLTANDVSVLLPLPTGPGQDLYLRPTSAGRGGPLLPEAEFDRIGRSLTNVVEDAVEYDALRVLAVRFDPCFQVTLETACQPQVRLVFQFLAEGGLTNDGAIHALYNVPLGELTSLVAELRGIALQAPENTGQPTLDVSPALRAQGMDGDYARGLHALIQRYAGPDTLARMTFMTRTNARSGQWEFGGFHLGTWPDTGFPAAGPIAIEGALASSLQTVSRRVSDGFEFTVQPEFLAAEGRAGVSTSALRAMTAPERVVIHAWAIRQQDPAALTADTTDCASCHLAGHIAHFLETDEPALVTPALAAARGARELSPAEDNGDNLRAFGYFNMAPVVTQRVANETRAVVEAFAALP